MYFELTFFDFPAAENFKELLGADLSISETSSLPEVKQTYFWILLQKLTKDRTSVKISKLHIYQEGKHCHYFYSYNLRYNAIFTFHFIDQSILRSFLTNTMFTQYQCDYYEMKGNIFRKLHKVTDVSGCKHAILCL